MKRILLVTLAFVLLSSLPADAAQTPEEILSSMTTQEKICQLLVPAYRKINGGTTDDVTVLNDEVAQLISTYPFAGIILYGENLTANDTGTLLIHQLQQANVSQDTRPQLFIMVDQEGGLVARLARSTAGISPMALAATGNPTHTQEIAQMMGTEIQALGINVNLAPLADVLTNPRLESLVVRTFGDSPDVVAAHAQAYLSGLRQAGVLNCLKHFPGMGSASENTDDTNQPVIVDKTRAQMDACELLPFKRSLEAGLVDMMMVTHTSYPSLETRTFQAADNQTYTLPASLSPAVVTGLLREELGFDGLVVADAILGTLITHHFSAVQVLQLALEAGVDILPYSLELNQPSSVEAFKTALETFGAQVSADTNLQTKLDAAVTRILTFKQKHGLLTPYTLTDVQAQTQAQTALQTVSTQEHHDIQWPVALEAITLVDHLDNALPLSPDEKVAVLHYYNSQTRSVNYGLAQLVTAGQLTQEQAAAVKVMNVHDENLLTTLEEVETVVILSSVYYESELSPDSPVPYSDEIKVVLPLLETLRARGAKIIIASCHLPYDLGLYYGEADALLAGYLANGMSTAIETADNQPKFGALVPAIIYKLYDQQADFCGRLPVAIPDVIDGLYQLDQTLLPTGWGLRLASASDPGEPSDDQQPPSDNPPVDNPGNNQPPSDEQPTDDQPSPDDPPSEQPPTDNDQFDDHSPSVPTNPPVTGVGSSSGGCGIFGGAWCWLLLAVALRRSQKR